MTSDFEAASALTTIAERQTLDAASRERYQAALDRIGSQFERSRARDALDRAARRR